MKSRFVIPVLMLGVCVYAGNVWADGTELAQAKGCLACHDVKTKKIGPAYTEVAAKYKDQADAEATIMTSIKNGGSGKWGGIPMPPQPTLNDDDLKQLAAWVLSQ